MIHEFHANAGRVGGRREEYSLLLLHHTGAKPGVTRANPVRTWATPGATWSSQRLRERQAAPAGTTNSRRSRTRESRWLPRRSISSPPRRRARSASDSSRSKPRDTRNLPTLLEKTPRVFPV